MFTQKGGPVVALRRGLDATGIHTSVRLLLLELAPQLMTRPGPAGRVSVDQDNPWAEEWKRQSLEDLRDDLEGFLKR